MSCCFAESTVEQAGLSWYEKVDWPVKNGAEAAPDPEEAQ
jgi:hypothetical protein